MVQELERLQLAFRGLSDEEDNDGSDGFAGGDDSDDLEGLDVDEEEGDDEFSDDEE